MPALSLRTRLLLGMGFVAIVLTGVSIVIVRTTQDVFLDRIDRELAVAVAGDRPGQFRFDERPGGARPGGPRGNDDVDSPERLSELFEGVVDGNDELRTVYTPNLGGTDVALPAIGAAEARAAAADGSAFTTDALQGDLRYRVRATKVDGGAVFVVAQPLADYDETIDRLVVVVAGGTLVILVVLGLVGFWVVHLGIRPVDRMTETATAIAAGDLSARVPDVSPGTEAGRLGLALNTMLGRIEEAFAHRARSERRLRQFVADASHELRTPVATIRGYAELYRLGGLEGKGELDDALRRTEQESVRMSRLVEDLLDLARLDEGRPLERRPVDLGQLLDDAASDARAVDPTRSVTVTRDPGAVIEGDEDRLRQVLGNVVTNALVHTPAGTPIEATVGLEGDAAVVSVTDHGDGMPPDVASRVTERFFRADPSRSRAQGGSGLGLAIVAAVVDAHGGTIAIESDVGVGTTVRITLPAAAPVTSP